MIAVNRILLGVIIVFLASGASYAKATCSDSSSVEALYPPIVLGDGSSVNFLMAESAVDSRGEVFPITVMAKWCGSDEAVKIGELPYLGDPGKVESAFLGDSDFDGVDEVFVIHRVTLHSDTGIPYGSDYYTVMVYKRLASFHYEVSGRVRHFFGSGGDVLVSPESEEMVYKFPYKSEKSIRERLRSAQYRTWYEKKPLTSKVIRKTYLYDQPNTADKTAKYLVAGDEVVVLNQAAGWLETVFYNKRKGPIAGWLICEDTLLCD